MTMVVMALEEVVAAVAVARWQRRKAGLFLLFHYEARGDDRFQLQELRALEQEDGTAT